jgi:histidyl-tRNA synthetase
VAEAAPKSADHLCDACADHLARLKEYLGVLGIPFAVNHRMVRGLDYYTRTVFEIEPQEAGGQSSIGGGGRYDGLIEQLGGKPTPAVGFATGIERVILNLKKQGIEVPGAEKPGVYIAFMGEAGRQEAFRLTAALRSEGIGTVCAVGSRSLKAQLRQANTIGARYAVIIGDAEVAAAAAVVREMAPGEQKSVPFSALAAAGR